MFLKTGKCVSLLVIVIAWVFLAHLLEARVDIWAIVVAAECTLESTAISFRRIAVASILSIPEPEIICLNSRSLSFNPSHMSPSLI